MERDPHVESSREFVATFQRLVRAQLVACDRCGGTGRSAGWTDGGRGPETFAKAVAWDRDSPICDRCDGTGRVSGLFTGPVKADITTSVRERVGDRSLDALANGRERRDEHAIYRDHLAPAYARLKFTDRPGYFLIGWTWMLQAQQPSQLGPADRLRLVAATKALADELPDPIRLPGDVRAQWSNRQRALVAAKGKQADRRAQEERDREIRRLRAQGLTLADLAARFDLDKSRLSRICST